MMPMRIAVDAHAIGRHLTGNEVYIRSLLEEFGELDSESLFIAYISEPNANVQLPGQSLQRHVSANPYLRLGVDIPRAVAADRPDLLHVQYTAPLFCGVPVVSTVHDVSFIETPEFFTFSRRQQLRLTVRRTVAQAARVITVSEFSRDAILRAYPVAPEKICVIPNAANPVFRMIPRERAVQSVRDRFGIEAPFVFSVGDLQPRKNHIGLIRAFENLIASHPNLPHHLVITGQDTWYSSHVHHAAATSVAAARIHFTGFVSDTELVNLYNASECFVFPSFYEGFGLPILEAMACGRPVACSGVSAMPEVAKGAGLLFDPGNPASITRAMADVLTDRDLSERMQERGQRRAKDFSWRKSAQATLEVYRDVVRENAPATSPEEAVAGMPDSLAKTLRQTARRK